MRATGDQFQRSRKSFTSPSKKTPRASPPSRPASRSHQQYSTPRSSAAEIQSAHSGPTGPRPSTDFSSSESGLQATGEPERPPCHYARHRSGQNHQAYSRRLRVSVKRPLEPTSVRLRAERESFFV